jgi:hypothetical protein
MCQFSRRLRNRPSLRFPRSEQFLIPVEHAAELIRQALRPQEPPAAAAAPSRPFAPEIDLALVEKRARLKAEACRWAMQRRKHTKDKTWSQEDVDAGYRGFIAQAKQLHDCYLWMLTPDRWLPDDARVEEIAAAFDNLALAIEIERAGGPRDEDFRTDILHLLAECQSALRAALLELSDAVEDRDQLDAYFWLKATTRDEQIFVRRHIRLDDPAFPADWYDRERRLETVQESQAKAQKQVRERTQAFNKLRFHARRIAEATPGSDCRDDWTRVIDTADKLLAMGMKPSSKEMRALVLPIAELLPEGVRVSAGWKQIDQHIR